MCALQLLRVSVHERISAAAEDVLMRVEKGEEATEISALRALLTERLTAAAEEIVGLFEETVAEYEDRAERSEREICRQRRLLDAVLKPEVKLHRADVQQLLVVKEEVPSEQQDWSSSLDREDPEPPLIKEEQEELWTSQEGEQLQGLEEADITKFPFTPDPVKSEEDEENPQSSQLHQRHTEHMDAEEDCGGPGTGLFSVAEIEVSRDGWEETRELQSGLNSQDINSELPVCDSSFNSPEKLFSCSICGEKFTGNRFLETHLRTHSREKPFGCSFCEKGFTPKHFLTNQLSSHAEEKRFLYCVCGKRFAWSYNLNRHKCVGSAEERQDASESSKVQEEEIPDTLKPDEILQGDAGSDVTERPFGCSECTKRFRRKISLQEHMRIHTGEKPYGCSVCFKYFSFCGSLHKHMRIHTGEKPFSCSVCGNRFTESGHLKVHLRTHTREKPFSCSECGKVFGSKTCVKRHQKSHRGEKPFSCSVCEKVFIQSGHLQLHMRIHTGEKPFSCLVCGKRFIQKAHLLHHMAVHSEGKPFSCSICNRTFAWRRQIKRHKCVDLQSSQLQQGHTEQLQLEAAGEDCGGPGPDTDEEPGDASAPETDNSDDWRETREPQSGLNSLNNEELPVSDSTWGAGEKPFRCSECGKRFGFKRNLMRHLRSHTGEKPYSCSFCEKSFTRSGALKKHMRIHTGEKPFSCSVCQKSFTQNAHLQTHMKIHTVT